MAPDLPPQRGPLGPRRWAAVSGAVAVSALTIASAMGLGPGTAMARPAHDQAHNQAHDQTQGAPHAAAVPGSKSTAQQPMLDAAKRQMQAIRDSHSRINQGARRQHAATADRDPAVPAHSGKGKRIVFDVSDQRVWLVNAHNAAKRTYLVSGSTSNNLKPGTYDVYSKSRNAVAYNHKETMNYMVRFAHGKNAAIGFHDIPAYHDGTLAESRSELGTPQSAGCIRQWIKDAKALWEFAPVGTTVVVRR
ncbi:MAG: L,D-transpeptidase [Nocardioidaceae bacterium]